jgi:hypothetical protein
MRKLTTLLPALVIGLAGVLAGTTSARAVPITYTEQATASGSLGGVAFTDATVTLTMVNDTANVTGGPLLFVNTGSTTLNIAGFSAATITDTTQAAANQTVPDAGFGDVTEDLAILFTESAAFSTYNLETAIGPVSGTAIFNAGSSFPTTGGAFVLTNVTGGISTFTAVTATVAAPEPASLTLLGAGLIVLGAMRRRRRP